jgi:hypothetical protein
MLSFAWHRLSERPAMWGIAAVCAMLVAVPGAIAATHLATPFVALILTGDLGLAITLLPAPFTGSAAPATWAAVATAALAALLLWSRLFAAGVWASASDEPTPLRAALRATRAEWRSVAFLYLQSYVLIAVLMVAVMAVGLAAAGGEVFTAMGLFAIGAAALLRSAVRVTATTAIRAAVLDGYGSSASWRRAVEILKDRTTDVVAVWFALVAAGAAVWMGGRLISPVLQDTALEYPATTRYAVTREIAQLLLAVPLEAFLIALSLGAWTALYVGVERTRPVAKPTQPPITRALGAVVGLTILANGIPTIVDALWSKRQENAAEAIASQEVSLDDVLSSPTLALPKSSTSYKVRASIDERSLRWTTRIAYTNQTDESLATIGLHVYPAAYERDLSDIPLAPELLQSDYDGIFRTTARPGNVEVDTVSVNGESAGFSLNDTALSVELRHPLRPGDSVRIALSLSGELPIFPERYGTWDGMTLLGNWVPVVAQRRDGEWLFDRFGAIGDPFFADVADYSIAIETDDREWVIGTGVLTKIEQSGPGRRTWYFDASAVRDVAFALAPFVRALEDRVGRVTVRSWYQAQDRLTGAANLDTATSAIGRYTAMFGPLPLDEVEVVSTTGRLGGMEYPGVVFIGRSAGALEGLPVLPDLVRYAGFTDAQRRYVLGHELAHQWWYAAVGNDGVREPWLDEAFAEVSTILWLRDRERDDRTWRMTNFSEDIPEASSNIYSAVDDFSSNREYSATVYSAGAATLLQLRDVVGPKRFIDIMRMYYEENVLEIATIDDFIDIVREVGGEEAARVLTAGR